MSTTKNNVSLIVAMANGEHQRVIGVDNTLPWRISDDLKRFKAITLGKPIIMGRKTWQSIGSKPLPGRENIVLTQDKTFTAEGATVLHSLEAALTHTQNEPEVMIIGGAQIYTQALPLASNMYLTVVEHDVKGDAFFPQWDEALFKQTLKETHTQAALGDQPELTYHFINLERI